MDQNAIKRKIKLIRERIQSQIKLEKRMKELRDEIDLITLWNEETMEKRLRLYREYGTTWEIYRNGRIILKYYKYELLKNNITG